MPLEHDGLKQFKEILTAVELYNIDSFRAIGFKDKQIGDVVEFFGNSFFENFLHCSTCF